MKLLSKDIKKGYVKLTVENLDDLWYLSQITDTGDLVKGVTFRKIKIGDGSSDRNAKIIKKKIFIELRTEKIEFHKYSDILRISGKITQGPEDVQIGTYHTFNVADNTTISLQKDKFLGFQIDKLKEASKEKKTNILIVVFDRENATFALMKNYGFDILLNISGEVAKKDDKDSTKGSSLYKQIITQLKEYDSKHKLNKIVAASPAFWKEYLINKLETDDIKKKIITASCNSVGINGINEVIRRPEVRSALGEDRIINEVNLVENLMNEIGKDGNYSYGIREVRAAVDAGAVKILLVTDTLIHKLREDEIYYKLDKIMKNADSMQAKIHIISAEHDGGKKLDGIGGIGAVLRYKL